MNRFALIGATLAVLACAAVALAASPLPSVSPAASPMASPMASGSPLPATSANPSPTPTTAPSSSPSAGSSSSATPAPKTWTADVNPVNIEGTATLVKNSDGTGKLTLKLTGMINQTNWTVDVEPGAVQHPNTANTIALKQGEDVQRIAPDTIAVNLTKTEMQDYQHAISANPGGVTIFVSDGHRLSAATITNTQ